jgi:hypothetical protein
MGDLNLKRREKKICKEDKERGLLKEKMGGKKVK